MYKYIYNTSCYETNLKLMLVSLLFFRSLCLWYVHRDNVELTPINISRPFLEPTKIRFDHRRILFNTYTRDTEKTTDTRKRCCVVLNWKQLEEAFI